VFTESDEEKLCKRSVEMMVGGDFPLSDDIFINHFESPRQGSGRVEDVKIEADRTVQVIFETAKSMFNHLKYSTCIGLRHPSG
jgi:hypothetical protein